MGGCRAEESKAQEGKVGGAPEQTAWALGDEASAAVAKLRQALEPYATRSKKCQRWAKSDGNLLKFLHKYHEEGVTSADETLSRAIAALPEMEKMNWAIGARTRST